MNNEFWDGFDSGYSYGFDDGMVLAINRLVPLHKKKTIIAILASALIASGVTACITHLTRQSKVKQEIKSWNF